MSLSDIKIRTAKPEEKPYKLQDGDGLYLDVRPSGAKVWRYRYWLTPKKDGIYTIGDYPDVSLAQARAERARVRQLVKDGLNPTSERKLDQVRVAQDRDRTFLAVAEEWKEACGKDWKPNTRRQVNTFLYRDLLDKYGPLPITEVNSAHILAAIRKIEQRGAKSIARLVRQWAGQIFQYAISSLYLTTDPTYSLRGSIKMPKTKHNPHLSPQELPAFLAALYAYEGYGVSSRASKLLMLTMVRTTELRLARWSEIDFESATWRIGIERVKMEDIHIVPLSQQAMDILRELKILTGNGTFIFPNRRRPGEDGMALSSVLRVIQNLGYAGRVTGHGFRGTAYSILTEHGFDDKIIDRQLDHKERNKVKAAYDHAKFLPQRREMMQWWADYLDERRRLDTGSESVE